jgi:hypothetical protein
MLAVTSNRRTLRINKVAIRRTIAEEDILHITRKINSISCSTESIILHFLVVLSVFEINFVNIGTTIRTIKPDVPMTATMKREALCFTDQSIIT